MPPNSFPTRLFRASSDTRFYVTSTLEGTDMRSTVMSVTNRTEEVSMTAPPNQFVDNWRLIKTPTPGTSRAVEVMYTVNEDGPQFIDVQMKTIPIDDNFCFIIRHNEVVQHVVNNIRQEKGQVLQVGSPKLVQEGTYRSELQLQV